jgi:histone chaperone ASF1
MATVSLLNVSVRNNPAPFTDAYEFEITFECLEPLQKDLEWKLTYVGSATSYVPHLKAAHHTVSTNLPIRSEHDQELDSLLVGPIPVGVNKFVFEADPPKIARIPATEIIGVTVILLSCSYDDREFVRVGYYVNNEYTDEALAEDPPAKPVIEKVRRNILAEKPRVTRFAIKWDSEESAPAEFPPEQPDVDAQEDDGATYGAEEEEEVEVEAEGSAAAAAAAPKGEDVEMEGAERNGKEEHEESDAGSEDLEAESEGDEEEELEEEEGEGEVEGEANGDMEVDDKEQSGAATNGVHDQQQHQADVMVH